MRSTGASVAVRIEHRHQDHGRPCFRMSAPSTSQWMIHADAVRGPAVPW